MLYFKGDVAVKTVFNSIENGKDFFGEGSTAVAVISEHHFSCLSTSMLSADWIKACVNLHYQCDTIKLHLICAPTTQRSNAKSEGEYDKKWHWVGERARANTHQMSRQILHVETFATLNLLHQYGGHPYNACPENQSIAPVPPSVILLWFRNKCTLIAGRFKRCKRCTSG